MNHPWITVMLAILLLIILLLPYEVVRFRHAGDTCYQWKALLWTWEREPKTMRLRLTGVLQLQHALLKLLKWFWRQAQDRLWAGILEMMKRWVA